MTKPVEAKPVEGYIAIDFDGNPVTPRVPEGSCCKRTLTDIGKFVDSEKNRAILDFSSSIVLSIRTGAEHLHKNLAEFDTAFSGALEVLSLTALVNSIAWWFCETSKRWQETAGQAFWTAARVMRSVLFLDQLHIFDLSKIAITIGNGIPIINLITNSVGAFANGFSLWNDVIELGDAKKKHEEHKRKYEEWTKKKDTFDIDLAKATDKKSPEQLANATAKKSPEQLAKYIDSYAGYLFGSKVQTSLSTLDNDKKLDYINKRFHHEVEKYKALEKNDKVEERKAWLSVADDVCGLAISILLIAGLCTGVGALAMTSALMLSLGIFAASVSLYKCYYAGSHQKEPFLLVPMQPALPS